MSNDTANAQHPIMMVIHTNLYAGNFEREMCAYVTGSIGECGVGDEMLEVVLDELMETGLTEEQAQEQIDEWAELTSQQPDENGCERPCSIHPTPGRWNNGRGGHFDDADFKAEAAWQGHKWPAYESVAIYFEEPLSPEQQSLFAARARQFAEKVYNTGSTRLAYGLPKVPMVVTGVNYIEREVTIRPKMVTANDMLMRPQDFDLTNQAYMHSLHPEYAARLWNAFFGTAYHQVDFIRMWVSIGGVIFHDPLGNVRIADFELAPEAEMRRLLLEYEMLSNLMSHSHVR